MARHLPRDVRYGEENEWKAIITNQKEAADAMKKMESHLKKAARNDLV